MNTITKELDGTNVWNQLKLGDQDLVVSNIEVMRNKNSKQVCIIVHVVTNTRFNFPAPYQPEEAVVSAKHPILTLHNIHNVRIISVERISDIEYVVKMEEE